MSLLARATTGKQMGAQIHVIIGENGVGKTTWATSHPNALLFDLEKGSGHIKDAVRLTPTDLAEFRSMLSELKAGNHAYQNLGIDSAEALEAMIATEVCIEGKVTSLEDVGGGYGKGHARTREIMREIMVDLQSLKEKGITSTIVAHTQIKTISNPATNQSYDRVIMRCNDKMAAVIRDLADNVFYATYKVFTEKEKGKVRAFGDGTRVMYTQWRPGFDAKNRLELPHEIPLSYEAFADACKSNPESDPSKLIEEIKSMAVGVDESLKATVAEQIEKFKTNSAKLKEVKNRLMKYVTKEQQ